MNNQIAQTPAPPYFVVIFTAQHKTYDEKYELTGARMFELVQQIDGYLGYESFQNPDGFGVTISYWKDRESILNWKRQADHRIAQKQGRDSWYAYYKIRICEVIEDYGFES